MHPHIEAQQYLVRATEAEKRSERVSDRAMKEMYLKIADQYRRLAQEAAGR